MPRVTSPFLSASNGEKRITGWPTKALSAFSLVEVVMALAVFAFAFIVIIGTLPMGLASARNAGNTLLQAQLVKQITNRLQETPFTNVVGASSFTTSPLLSTNYYFTRQGYPVVSASQAYFTMTGTLVSTNATAALLPSTLASPGFSLNMTTNLALIQLVISTADGTTNYYSSVIANLGSQ